MSWGGTRESYCHTDCVVRDPADLVLLALSDFGTSQCKRVDVVPLLDIPTGEFPRSGIDAAYRA